MILGAALSPFHDSCRAEANYVRTLARSSGAIAVLAIAALAPVLAKSRENL